MKKLTTIRLSAALFVGAMIVSACDGDKANSENEVRAFGKNFVEKLSANQLDSLKAAYPDIVNADSIAHIQSDTIIVAETAPGQYDMTLAEGVTLKVNRAEDGNVSVVESKGLFVFPADKVDIAKKTGMWNDSLNDARLNERMKDEDFFKWFDAKVAAEAKDPIDLTQSEVTYNSKTGYNYEWEQSLKVFQAVKKLTVTNNTSQPIKASDYSISYVAKNWACCEYEGWWSNNKSKSGVDLAPGESKTITLTTDYDEWGKKPKIENVKIKSKLSNKKDVSSYQPTGNEYQEYLNSKK